MVCGSMCVYVCVVCGKWYVEICGYVYVVNGVCGVFYVWYSMCVAYGVWEYMYVCIWGEWYVCVVYGVGEYMCACSEWCMWCVYFMCVCICGEWCGVCLCMCVCVHSVCDTNILRCNQK